MNSKIKNLELDKENEKNQNKINTNIIDDLKKEVNELNNKVNNIEKEKKEIIEKSKNENIDIEKENQNKLDE